MFSPKNLEKRCPLTRGAQFKKKTGMHQILSYLPSTDQRRFDICCQGHQLKQTERKFSALAAVQVQVAHRFANGGFDC